MKSEIFVKSVDIKGAGKGLVKSKWIEEDDRVEMEIFVDDCLYIGSQEQLKESSDHVGLQSVKEALTNDVEGVVFELDKRKLRLFVTNSLESSQSSDNSVEIVYLKIDLTIVRPEEMFMFTNQIVEDMMEMKRENAEDSKKLIETKEESSRLKESLEKLVAEKEEFDRNVLANVQLLLNTKKSRIVELERKISILKDLSKFDSSCSDLDKSDVPMRKEVKTFGSRRLSRDGFLRELQPSTSKQSSPSSKKIESKNSPRTPRANKQGLQSKTTPGRKLFDFVDQVSNNKSNDALNYEPQSPQPSASNENVFANIKVTPKSARVDRSDRELYTPNLRSRRRLNSSSSELSLKSSQEKSSGQAAQRIVSEKVNESPPKEKARGSKKKLGPREINSDELFHSDEDIFKSEEAASPQRLEDNDIVPNSQNSDSPSIFGFARKRKQQTPSTSKKSVDKKSKFSIDTIDVLGDDSF